MVKNPPADAQDAGDTGSILGPGRSPEVGNDNPLQYSCLANPMHRGAWRATVYGVTKSRTGLSNGAYVHWGPTSDLDPGHWFFCLFLFLIFYLTASGINCSMWDLVP